MFSLCSWEPKTHMFLHVETDMVFLLQDTILHTYVLHGRTFLSLLRLALLKGSMIISSKLNASVLVRSVKLSRPMCYCAASFTMIFAWTSNSSKTRKVERILILFLDQCSMITKKIAAVFCQFWWFWMLQLLGMM